MAWQDVVVVGRRVYREAIDDRLTGLAAEVAFFGVLSLFPGLLMLAAALGSLDSLVGSKIATTTEKEILRFLDLILTDQAGGAVDAVARLFDRDNSGVLTIASLVALLVLSRGFSAVLRALNLAYDVHEGRPWWKVRLWSLTLAVGSTLIAAIVLAMIVVGPLFGQGREVASLFGLGRGFGFIWRWLRWPLVFALLIAWATTLFYIGPNRRKERWRRDLPGATVAAVLWLVVSAGFNVYLQVAAETNPIYGVLGGGLILLVWLYLLSLSLLVGGELNAVLAMRGETPAGTREDSRTQPATTSRT
ncbi:MAG: YihY/virulence factor BrkB family protein [Actinomycetota bacterium]|nr:YihY/virulence factor BrkB family protein [Actinomycetota bacterium]